MLDPVRFASNTETGFPKPPPRALDVCECKCVTHFHMEVQHKQEQAERQNFLPVGDDFYDSLSKIGCIGVC